MNRSINNKFEKSWSLLMLSISLLVCIVSSGMETSAAQEESKTVPDFNFTCTQNGNDFILESKLSYWNGERDLPIQGAKIVFTNPSGEETNLLETVTTDMKGMAVVRIGKSSGNLISQDGVFSFIAEFQGNEKFDASEGQADVKPLNLSLSFEEFESVKTIVAEAFEIDMNGEKVPLDGWDIYFFVPRQFSLLPFGDGWFEEGRAELEFPTTIPGDSVGNLTIVARIEDHELYGDVEVLAKKEWGVVRPNVIVQKRRGLGDTDAPLWMVYTLIVLLSAVWFHYLYVFYVMIKIKKLQSNQEV